MEKKDNKTLGKKVLIIAATIVLIIICTQIPYDSIRQTVQDAGEWGPLIYILMFALLPIGFFPVPVLALAAGVSFGVFWGVVYTIIGSLINCSIMFFMSRYLARDALTEYANKNLSNKWKEKIFNAKRSSLNKILLICRLTPLIPYNLENYAFGLTSIPFKDYFITTFFGIIPATVIYINMGDKTLEVGSRDFWIAVIMVVALVVGSLILAKFIDKAEAKKKAKNFNKNVDDENLEVDIRPDGSLEEKEKEE
ncbi:MAG: TVP38/TMEM64 family protein [Finegoldia sp.]|nr:TVP38/TMEM64 family protein [Finegoldia sp.]